jgi:sodium-dependent dicarboxylate transporter 2/3/5
VLAGVMLVTALFSMFMSNTATTAMMIALIAPLARQVPRGDRFQKGLVLAVPFAANLGGIGTPIGTPPNAIALQAMNARGLEVNFFQWMFFATPLLIGALVVMWFFLLFLFRPRDKTVEVAVQASFTPSFNALTVYATFALTVGLWLSSPWLNSLFGLNIPNAVVAVVPAAVLTMTRIIGREDFNQLEWDVLFLIAGGIALGKGLSLTGLDKAIVEAVPAERMSLYVLTGACCLLVVGFGTVMSHTVATTLVVPLAMAVATGMAGGVELQVVPIMVAVASSFAVSLPISTPPNAIAYASGLVTTRDIMSVGVVTSILATILVVVTGPPTVEFLLRLVT